MLLNTDKIAVINFSLTSHSHNVIVVIFDNMSVNPSQSVKILGILIDNHLTFIKDFLAFIDHLKN